MAKKLNTLQQVINVSKHNEVSVQQIINGRIHTKTGWKSFDISREVRKEVALKTIQILGGRATTQKQIYNRLMYSKPQHWGLGRIIFKGIKSPIDKRKKIIVYSYTAGQDYVVEIRAIRNELKK